MGMQHTVPMPAAHHGIGMTTQHVCMAWYTCTYFKPASVMSCINIRSLLLIDYCYFQEPSVINDYCVEQHGGETGDRPVL